MVMHVQAIHLFSAEDQSLLNRRDTLLLLNTLLYPRDLFVRVLVLVLCDEVPTLVMGRSFAAS